MKPIISGIQQIGIGVADAAVAFDWYSRVFGTDVVVFKDSAPATLMQRYTGDREHKRIAILAMNMQGGGGFEIWQYTSRKPQPAAKQVQPGDYGINSVKIKCRNITAAYENFHKKQLKLLTRPAASPAGDLHFYLQDPFENIFEIVEQEHWFTSNKDLTGAVCGITIGVQSIEKSVEFYEKILGYDRVIFSGEGLFDDWQPLPGTANRCKRVLLGRTANPAGAFSKLLGPSQIELVQVMDRIPYRIFENRYWGDLGFIHICFDIYGMEQQELICKNNGYQFTVNSRDSFAMGKAAGHFAYNEDPDGTLIEYVETHKVPVFKKMGIYFDLRKRNPEKPLPDWMVKCLSFSRIRK